MPEGQFNGVGKRKCSIARVILKAGKGTFSINGRTLENYFPRPTLQVQIREPLEATKTAGTYDTQVNVAGGGMTGQAGAIRLGIARALLKMDEGLKSTLRRGGFLTRDQRVKERKKYGRRGARRGFQRSKR
jgi:small subunit ribosomal protein S9